MKGEGSLSIGLAMSKGTHDVGSVLRHTVMDNGCIAVGEPREGPRQAIAVVVTEMAMKPGHRLALSSLARQWITMGPKAMIVVPAISSCRVRLAAAVDRT